MKTISVSLSNKSYPIKVVANFDNKFSFWPLKHDDQVMLITNEVIANMYLENLLILLNKIGLIISVTILPDGEKYKSLKTTNNILTSLLKNNYDRDSVLIAFGGGVIGDIVGFVAALYKRGIRYIQLPTTLLSQVDASIGGKTGVNHSLGKNMIGVFYQPVSVMINISYLNSLPLRELSSGLAEVIKYGIAVNYDFFVWLEKNLENVMALDFKYISYCIIQCCKFKSKILSSDELDFGQRSVLNLGHTFGHAIESYMGYEKWLHGEAVSVGIVISVYISEQLGYLTTIQVKRILDLLRRASLPVNGPIGMCADKYFFYMKKDKKALRGNLRLVLPVNIGQATLISSISRDIIIYAIERSYN